MDRGAYWAVVHRITKSQTVLSERDRERERTLLVLGRKLIVCSNEGFILSVLLY